VGVPTSVVIIGIVVGAFISVVIIGFVVGESS